jgi:7-carboxy-7-deazaguanine synthase
MQAQISEIFNSIQGEGPYLGMRQVFVRFQACQLHCRYCDTPQVRRTTDLCKIEKTPGKGDFYSIGNPVEDDDVAEIIRKLWSISTKHISLTGGEPLIYADFIKSLDIEYPLYLETNSGFPDKALELKDIIAIASCDIKLSEHDSTDNYRELLNKELETISIFNQTSQTFVKIIILPETTVGSINEAVEGVASIDKNIPLILQPVTHEKKIPAKLLFQLMDFAGKKLNDVRIIPQTHMVMGLL